MRFSLRLGLPLAMVIALVALIAFPLIDRLTQRWFVRDLEIRARLVTEMLSEEVSAFDSKLTNSATLQTMLQKRLERLTRDERLVAVAICSQDEKLLSATKSFGAPLDCAAPSANDAEFVETSQGRVHVYREDVELAEGTPFTALIVHDMAFVDKRRFEARRALFLIFVTLLILVATLSTIVAHLTWRGWLDGVRDLLKVPKISRLGKLARSRPELKPIAKDLRNWAEELARTGGQRDPGQISWSPEALRSILQKELAGEEILILSNRQPYIHTKSGGKIQVQVPASGLVTALEPIMRACSGTWIAHGSGSGDRESVDEHDRVAVPPNNPSYKIRRVWLTPEQEKGYYYGFANEGLWPLCHIAHTRPIFRSEDFECYREVNRLFAETVVQEAKTKNPVVLVQDYHLAMAPRFIREKLPDATIITFWHIPWPNSEAFGICPWREEILAGLLGSSILGFHTRFHCHNFLDSIDRYLESRTERETMTISYGGEMTKVSAYPISIDWPPQRLSTVAPAALARKLVRERHGLPLSNRIAIGVDRLDYTKGILERFNGVERFLEQHPEERGRFSLVQIGAPTRSGILQYQQFVEQVRSEVARINQKFAPGPGAAPAIVLLDRHHEPEEIFEYFRAADICLVTSLHDGMNLVAKEFIGARDDDDGVLILSQFAGAALELPEALVINPYDVDQCAAAIAYALAIPEEERVSRMRSMRMFVQEFNVYRWAGRMLIDAAKIRKLADLRKHRTGTLRETFTSLRI